MTSRARIKVMLPRLRLAFALMGVCSLALGLIGPVSAGAGTQSKYGGTLVVGPR